MTPTIQQVVAELDVALADHDPYVWGGVSLKTGADCSGVIIAALEAVGVTGQPRTSQAQFAAWKPAPGRAYGIAVFFDVPGDGPSQPAHVGVCLTGTTMFEEPHTGLDAEVVPIPNIPGVESVMGYRYLPVSYAAPTPAPAPPPTKEVPSMFASDPHTGGVWATDANGDLYPTGGAPFVAALSSHPDYHAGATESGGANPCVGMAYWAADGNDGVMFFTQPTNGQGGWDGSTPLGAVPYDIYRFERNGTPV